MNTNQHTSQTNAGLPPGSRFAQSASIRRLLPSHAADSRRGGAPVALAHASRHSRAALLLLLASAGLACHDSSGGGTTQELDVVGLEAQTDSAHLGHELFVVVDVEAAKAATNVGLAFLVADAAEVDADVPEPALQLLDAESIAEVQAGNNAYELTLVLPEDAVAPGSYYLLAVVDPIGATPETDEDDNGYTVDEIRALGVRVTLNAPHALPDLVLEGIELDRWLVDVDQTPDAHPPAGAIGELPNADFGLSATIRSAGTETLNGVELGVFLQIPGEPATLLEIWDTAAQAYASSTTVASVVPGESSIVHLDLRLPAFLRSQLGPFLGDVVVSEVFVVVDPAPSPRTTSTATTSRTRASRCESATRRRAAAHRSESSPGTCPSSSSSRTATLASACASAPTRTWARTGSTPRPRPRSR